MMEPLLTPAQTRAFLSLPADGAWARAPRGMHLVCSSLAALYPDGVERHPGYFGARGGLTFLFRLTDKGRAVQARIKGNL